MTLFHRPGETDVVISSISAKTLKYGEQCQLMKSKESTEDVGMKR